MSLHWLDVSLLHNQISEFHNVNFFLDIPFMPTLLIVAILSYSDESTLILIRHGESLWNEKNLFSGCVDVPLTNKGIEEAIEAGKRIRNLPIDIIYTSALIRAQMTAMLALTQHRCYKVLPHRCFLFSLPPLFG